MMIVAFLRQILTEDQMFSFGWRIPFLSGVIIAGYLFFFFFFLLRTLIIIAVMILIFT